MSIHRHSISVYIPVYKAGPFMEKCCRTLFEQTLTDLEYVFVDDCTPDDSMEILKQVLDQYPHRKNGVKILRNETNLGVAKTIKKAIEACTGEYLIRCDPDDYVATDLYEKLLHKAQIENADVVVCDYAEVKADKITPRLQHTFQDGRDAMHLIMQEKMHGALWNKLIQRDLFSKIEFWPEMNFREDQVISIQIFFHCQNPVFYSHVGYFYRQNPNSLVNSPGVDQCLFRWDGTFSYTKVMIKFLESTTLLDIFAQDILKIKYLAKDFIWAMMHHWGYYWRWFWTYPELNLYGLFDKNRLPGIRRSHLIALLGLYPLYYQVKNSLKKGK